MRHWLPLLAALALPALTPVSGAAQRVGLEIRVGPDTVVSGRPLRLPEVRLTNLLTDRRWEQALRNSLPLRVRFELEIWRSREGWIDQYERTLTWELLVRHEALFDHYTVTTRQAGGATERAFTSWEALETFLGSWNRIVARPAGSGTYYFVVKVMITTLSEADLDELERFVQGRDPVGAERGRTGGGVYRFFLRMTGGLPVQQLERRSERVVVR